MWSTIELADGPLTAYELQDVARVPATVVIATCESATAGAGDQLHGLAATFLALGARSVVASAGALPDTPATRATMEQLHRRLAAGVAASAALAELSHDARRHADGGFDVTTASLVTLGVA
jgi:CHAT domain-containing protein